MKNPLEERSSRASFAAPVFARLPGRQGNLRQGRREFVKGSEDPSMPRANSNLRLQLLNHASRYEAPNRNLIARPYRPNHRASCTVRFGDHGIIGNVDPVVLDAN